MDYARWQDGTWYMNPFNLTCEQLIQLNKRESYEPRHDSHIWYTYYDWGYVRDEELIIDDRLMHEIGVHYYCPQSYSKAKRLLWLQNKGYPRW